jgi:hypothetical protein
MRLEFLALSVSERTLYSEQAAQRRDVAPVILEKDFWVCWLLAVLFRSTFADALVFKGGTSLSKVFGVIDRFSEDIDLSLSPTFLGLDENETPVSRNQANKWTNAAELACADTVRDVVTPELQATVAAVLGEKPGGWFEFQIDATTHSPVLLFHYPSGLPTGFAYLKRSVKLEFGSLTDQRPRGRHSVRPWIADMLENAFPDWQCDVVALELERSFWEKATILHAEHHRSLDKPMPDRFSRHYADTAALAQHSAATNALALHDLRDRVVQWKSIFFGSGWAKYDLAKPGTFRLVPPLQRIPELARDYHAMRDMYLSEPPTFDAVVAVLRSLEQRINHANDT